MRLKSRKDPVDLAVLWHKRVIGAKRQAERCEESLHKMLKEVPDNRFNEYVERTNLKN